MPASPPPGPARRRMRLARLRDGRLGALEARLPRRRARLAGFRGPLTARAGGKTVGGPLPGGRVTRGVGGVVLLALAGIGLRGFLGQKLDLAAQIERAARAQFIPQLEKQLGQKVEVGEFETDFLGRVIVRDVVVGRNPKLPTGALLRAQSLTLGLDIVGLALKQTKLPDAVNSVSVQAPQVYLERLPNGKFNLESLLPKTKNQEPTVWSGTVEIVNGRVFYFDRALPSRSGRKLKLDARGINGTVVAAGQDPYRFDFTLAQTRLPGGARAGQISARGAFAPQPRRAWLDLQFPALPVALLADHAFPRGEVIASSGTVSGSAQVALSGKTIVPRGALALSGISAVAAQVREPLAGRANVGAPLRIENLSGPLRFSNRAFESAGLTARVLGANWSARGTASAPQNRAPLFDLEIATRAAPLARLQKWAKPGALPIDFRSGDVGLSARVRGTARNAKISGALSAPNVRVASKAGAPASFNAAMPQLSASFVAEYAAQKPLKFAASLSAPSAQGALRGANGGSGAATDLEITLRGGAGPNSPLEVGARARTWRAASAKYGATNGTNLRLDASTPALAKPNWRGQVALNDVATSQINLDAIAPGTRQKVREIGAARALVNFSNLGRDPKTARASADFALARVTLSPAAVPTALRAQVPASALTLRDLRGRVTLARGQISVRDARAGSGFGGVRVSAAGRNFALELPDVRLSAAQINPFLRARGVATSGDWRGRVVVAGAPNGAFDARFELQSARASARDLSSGATRVILNNPVVRGRAQIKTGGATRGEATLSVGEVALRSGPLGRTVSLPAAASGARLVGARATINFSPDAWAARADAVRAAVPIAGGRVASVSAASVLAQSGANGGIVLSRLSARFAGGRFDGTARLSAGKLSARALARDVRAAALQTLLAPDSLRAARLSGTLDAVVAVENGGNPTLEARLARGSVFVVKQNARVPLDAARARVEIAGKTALVREAILWSEGARFRGAGRVDLVGRTIDGLPLTDGTLQVDALRLATWARRLQALGVAGLDGKAWKQAALDGLVSGDFRLTGGANPRVDGALNLRAATAFGADISSSSAQIAAAPLAGNGWRVRVADWNGRIEGAPFSGAIALDTAGNTWALKLQTEGVDAGRAARLRSLTARNGGARLLPLEGDLSADIDLAGVLKPDAGDAQPFFVPRAGYAKINAREIAWQGRPIGTLVADLAVDGDLARIRTLELRPTASDTNLAGAGQTAQISASGTVPLAPDAPGLNVDLNVGEAPLQFFVDATRDARDILEGSGVTLTALDRVVEYADALPPGTRGRLALRASVEGTLRRPIINVPALTLRDGRTPLPFGGFSPPATLDVGFSYDGRVATINQGEFRLQKTAADRAGAAPQSATAQDVPEGETDDTLLRIEPGATVDPNGEIALGADVFNANLSQLATWVPALRNARNDPILRGELSEFSLRLSGPTRAPDVIGSVQAENLRFNENTLDRLRLARFEIRDGRLQIAPGNFTVAKGAFQSSAASGSVGWDWARGGPQPNAPLMVNFPVETRDFAALAGLFVPALSQVGAEELSGGVQVGGTLADPKLSGRVTLRGARFSLQGPDVAVPVGLTKVSGTVRFTDEGGIEIDADDPLRGSLARAEAIVAPAVKGQKTKALPPQPPVALAGDWRLTGAVGLDLSAQSLSNLPRAIARQRYDLAFALDGGAVSTGALAGVRDADLAARLTTGADGAQRVRWMIAARGRRKANQNRGGGELISVGALRLRPDFTSGTDALLRSTAETFGEGEDFAPFAVAKRVKIAALPDRRPQFVFDDLEWGYTGVGSGQVEGRLVLDNRGAIQKAPDEAIRLKNAAAPKLRDALSAKRSLLSATDGAATLRLGAGGSGARAIQFPEFEGAEGAENEAALRLGGRVTLKNATIVGAPASGDGVVTRLSLLPDGPRFDVRLVLGDDVQFVTSAFRAGLAGELVASGVPSDPQLLGTVETRNGQVRFPNARARVTQGRVTVALNRDPATDLLRTRVDIDATATGRAGQYLITLGLSGPLDLSGEGRNLQNLRVDVTSNPPLSQSQAFAQLLGTAPAGDGEFSANAANQAYAGAVLQVLSAPLFSGVERSVAQALGLDSVSFEYRFDEPLAVQFSKAVSDRVFVTYRRSFGTAQSVSGNVTSSRTPFELSIEYRLKGNLRLGLKTDESRITTLTLGQTYRF